MRQSLVAFVVVMAAAVPAVAQQVVYREVFPNNGAAPNTARAIAQGWQGVRGGSTTNELQIFDPGSPTLPAAVNSSPTAGVDGQAFWSPKTHDVTIYTTEIAALGLTSDRLTSLTFETRHTNNPPGNTGNSRDIDRVAVLVGGVWYISQQTFTYTGNGTTDWQLNTFTFAGALWAQGVVNVGDPAGAGPRQPLLADFNLALPVGAVQAVGIFTTDSDVLGGDIQGNHRYDNFTVLANAASISLTKTATVAAFAQPGDAIPYTLSATNTSLADLSLSNVVITDPRLPVLACVPVQPATLAVGASLTCTGTYVVTAADVLAGVVVNTASVSATPPTGGPVTANAAATVRGIAPAISDTRLAVTSCTLDLKQDWVPVYTKLQYEVWNEDEVKFTGAFDCSDSWHETLFAADVDAAPQNFSIAVLGTYAARYRVQGVRSTQCKDSQAVGLIGVQTTTMPNVAATSTLGTTLTGAGKFIGRVSWDPEGAVPEGRIR